MSNDGEISFLYKKCLQRIYCLSSQTPKSSCLERIRGLAIREDLWRRRPKTDQMPSSSRRPSSLSMKKGNLCVLTIYSDTLFSSPSWTLQVLLGDERPFDMVSPKMASKSLTTSLMKWRKDLQSLLCSQGRKDFPSRAKITTICNLSRMACAVTSRQEKRQGNLHSDLWEWFQWILLFCFLCCCLCHLEEQFLHLVVVPKSIWSWLRESSKKNHERQESFDPKYTWRMSFRQLLSYSWQSSSLYW